jgi:hypothetical protein
MELNFPENETGVKLKLLEESITCQICKDYYVNAHIISCGHSFCSECIRSYFDSGKTTCPFCPCKADSTMLRQNRSLNDATKYFESIKPILHNWSLNTFTLDPIDGNEQNKLATSSSNGDSINKFIPHRLFFNYNKNKMKNEILQLCKDSNVILTTDGQVEDLQRLYRELVTLNNSQINSPSPLTFTECVTEVNKRERIRIAEKKKTDWMANNTKVQTRDYFTTRCLGLHFHICCIISSI